MKCYHVIVRIVLPVPPQGTFSLLVLLQLGNMLRLCEICFTIDNVLTSPYVETLCHEQLLQNFADAPLFLWLPKYVHLIYYLKFCALFTQLHISPQV